MTGGNRGRNNQVRHRVPDDGRDGGGRVLVRPDKSSATGVRYEPDAPGGIRLTIAELRAGADAAAELERASEPPSTRRAILALAFRTGQPISEVAGLRLREFAWLVSKLDG